jgi:hypothetical protein
MASSTGVNQQLVESLAQIILALTQEERELLDFQVQRSTLSDEAIQASLHHDLQVGLAQLEAGQSTEYDQTSLLTLLENIRERGKQRLVQREAQ